MSFSYLSNVPYSCVVSMKGYEYLRSAERIYSRSPPRTSWVHFSGHWRPSIHDRYLAHISRSWSTKDNSIEICKRWKEYKPTHMVSRSWSVKDNSVETSLECHQWSNTGHTSKTTSWWSLWCPVTRKREKIRDLFSLLWSMIWPAVFVYPASMIWSAVYSASMIWPAVFVYPALMIWSAVYSASMIWPAVYSAQIISAPMSVPIRKYTSDCISMEPKNRRWKVPDISELICERQLNRDISWMSPVS